MWINVVIEVCEAVGLDFNLECTRSAKYRLGRFEELRVKYIELAGARRVLLNPRNAEEILGYGDHGLPQ